MLWAALLLPPRPDEPLPSAEALRAVAIWALQFTPRVAVCEDTVLMEVEGSARLFGGKRALRAVEGDQPGDVTLLRGASAGVSASS